MSLKVFALLSVCALFACGSDGPGGSDSSGLYSCDFTTGGQHQCVEYDWNGGGDPQGAWEQACTSEHGTAGDACSHTGAVGGCKITTNANGVTIHATSWVYSGDASSLQAGCTQSGGTFVTP